MGKLDELKTLMEAALKAEQDYPIHIKMHHDSAEYVFAAARLKGTRDALNAKVTPAMTRKLLEIIAVLRGELRGSTVGDEEKQRILRRAEEIERSL